MSIEEKLIKWVKEKSISPTQAKNYVKIRFNEIDQKRILFKIKLLEMGL